MLCAFGMTNNNRRDSRERGVIVDVRNGQQSSWELALLHLSVQEHLLATQVKNPFRADSFPTLLARTTQDMAAAIEETPLNTCLYIFIKDEVVAAALVSLNEAKQKREEGAMDVREEVRELWRAMELRRAAKRFVVIKAEQETDEVKAASKLHPPPDRRGEKSRFG